MSLEKRYKYIEQKLKKKIVRSLMKNIVFLLKKWKKDIVKSPDEKS
jgi:uncharacterized protein (UPF0305 family)